MAKHHPDLVMSRKQPGIAIGRLCEKCDGKCVICDSFVNPSTIVHTCDECNYGSFEGRCVVCGGVGVTDAYYCSEPASFPCVYVSFLSLVLFSWGERVG